MVESGRYSRVPSGTTGRNSGVRRSSLGCNSSSVIVLLRVEGRGSGWGAEKEGEEGVWLLSGEGCAMDLCKSTRGLQRSRWASGRFGEGGRLKPAPCRRAGDSAGRSDRRVNENRRMPFPESRSWDVCIGSSLCSVSTAGVHEKSHFRLQRRLDTGVSGSRSSSAGAPEKEGRGGADPAWCIANITANRGLCGATPNGAVCQLFGHMVSSHVGRCGTKVQYIHRCWLYPGENGSVKVAATSSR